MNDQVLFTLLSHIAKEWALVAITLDEVSDLRAMGYVEPTHLALTNSGQNKLTELAIAGYGK